MNRFCCQTCATFFTPSILLMIKHLVLVHKNDRNLHLVCEVHGCQKTFTSVSSVYDHMQLSNIILHCMIRFLVCSSIPTLTNFVGNLNKSCKLCLILAMRYMHKYFLLTMTRNIDSVSFSTSGTDATFLEHKHSAIMLLIIYSTSNTTSDPILPNLCLHICHYLLVLNL